MASVKWISGDSGNDVSPVCRETAKVTNAELLFSRQEEYISMESYLKFLSIISRQSIWQRNQQNVIYIVQPQ